jgi:L-threonylcarbamoyladenylate synthase
VHNHVPYIVETFDSVAATFVSPARQSLVRFRSLLMGCAVSLRKRPDFSVEPVKTQYLQCDPRTISFSDIGSGDLPTFTQSATETALRTAAAHIVRSRSIVAFPTETVYGLGANALDRQAVAQIFATKGRPADNPLIVHVSSLPMLRTLLPKRYEIPPIYQKLMDAFWPGPLTLLFPWDKRGRIPSIITAGQPTVAIRMPSHPVARALIAVSGKPLAAPSANTSGRPSPTRAEHVIDDLAGKVAIVLNGGYSKIGLESTVIDGLNEDGNIRILRPGGVTVEDIERVLGEGLAEGAVVPKVLVHGRDFKDAKAEAAPATPGMKYRHYAPKCPVVLLDTSQGPPGTTVESLKTALIDAVTPILPPRDDAELRYESIKVGLLFLGDSERLENIVQDILIHIPDSCVEVTTMQLGRKDDPAETAHLLFNALLQMDVQEMQLIIMEGVDEEREGLAVMNRMRKAAAQTRRIDVDAELASYSFD